MPAGSGCRSLFNRKRRDTSVTEEIQNAPPHLSAEILFATQLVTDTQNTSFQTLELMRKDQPLVQLVPSKETTSANTTELIFGKNTRLSDDKRTLLADLDGYPILSQKTCEKVDVILVEIIPLVTISGDEMQALITLYPPISDCPELSGELLIEILADNRVRFGLSPQHLNSLLLRCREEQCLLKDEVVAQGLLPLDGKDSFLRFSIEVGPLPGKLMGNGKIDFRERKMFVGVTKGQKIATRIPATNGTPGINVSGDEILQTPGKNFPVNISDDAEYDEETGIIHASHGGILSMVNENSIKVCAKQVISGNIDYSTGNIESHDAVEIDGTILPGFKVSTHGDLLLNGNARSATIKCNGNLVVKGGILGDKCKVKVKGDADFSFMEQGRLRAEGKVIIRKQAYYTRIMADGEIHCEETCQIMSGVLMSGASLNLGNVGSPNAPAALLAAGVAPGRYLRYLNMRAKLRDIEQERLLFLQRFGLKKNLPQRESLEKSIDTLYQDMNKLNLIPGTSTANEESGVEYLRRISITVHGTVFSGTELQIGNVTKTLEHNLSAVRFVLDKYESSFIESNLQGDSTE